MESHRLKYELVMDYVKNGILTGSLKKGDKLYSESQLMAKFNVSRHTVRQAVMRLAQDGFIDTQHGKGSFVVWEENKVEYTYKEQRTILVIASYLNNHIFPEIIKEIENLASENKYTVMISCTHNRIFKERECLSRIMNSDFAGIIAEPAKSALPSPNRAMYEELKRKGVPVIYIHGCYDFQTDDYVMVDDIKAGYDATNHLIEQGHTRIAGVFKLDDIQGHKRYEGMIKALCEKNLRIDERNILWFSTEDQKVVLNNPTLRRLYLERLLNCSASICYNDDMAIAVADDLFEMGINIPYQHSIVSFDNTPYGDAYRVPITSMEHPYGKIGEIAFTSLLAKIKDNHQMQQHRLVVSLIKKKSVINLM